MGRDVHVKKMSSYHHINSTVCKLYTDSTNHGCLNSLDWTTGLTQTAIKCFFSVLYRSSFGLLLSSLSLLRHSMWLRSLSLSLLRSKVTCIFNKLQWRDLKSIYLMQKPNSNLCFEAHKTEIVFLDHIWLGLRQLLKLIKYAHDLWPLLMPGKTPWPAKEPTLAK